MIQGEGAADHGLFARDAASQPLMFDVVSQAITGARQVDAKPQLAGKVSLADGRTAVPAFQLIAKRCLEPQYAADSVAAETGIGADVIRRIAAELGPTGPGGVTTG